MSRGFHPIRSRVFDPLARRLELRQLRATTVSRPDRGRRGGGGEATGGSKPPGDAAAVRGGATGGAGGVGAPDAAVLPPDSGPMDAGREFAPDVTPPKTDGPPTPGVFRHPGGLVDRAQLDFVKARIADGTAPWKAAFDKAKASKWAVPTYAPQPLAVVQCGPYSNPNVGCSEERSDAIAAYTQALLWYFTGEPAFAQKSIEIMNAWSATLTGHTGHNAPLQSAWASSVWPRAAEIIRYTSGRWRRRTWRGSRSSCGPSICPWSPGGTGEMGTGS